MWLKIRDSHLGCKVANKCFNVRPRVEVVEWNKRWSSTFICRPVNPQCLWKKTVIKKQQILLVEIPVTKHLTYLVIVDFTFIYLFLQASLSTCFYMFELLIMSNPVIYQPFLSTFSWSLGISLTLLVNVIIMWLTSVHYWSLLFARI